MMSGLANIERESPKMMSGLANMERGSPKMMSGLFAPLEMSSEAF